MLLAYFDTQSLEPQPVTANNEHLLKKALWIDLITPSKEEENLLERHLKLEIPTRADMVEIEPSSRLYKDKDVYFMTATMIAQHDSAKPILDPVTFIVSASQLITVRYIEPKAFVLFLTQLRKQNTKHLGALNLFLDLLEATVDRLADTLELVGHRLDEYSKNIFISQNTKQNKLDYQLLIQTIGANGDLNSKARESLVTFNRLVLFLGNIEDLRMGIERQQRLLTLKKDIDSLSDHANFLSTKINFLLDATLGMVGIEQNNIIKIFSVAAVIFLPPTLVASIYGMNFRFMPELSWQYGYIFSLSLIAIAAWLPYKYFKYKKWL
jgi:magnesium transporter